MGLIAGMAPRQRGHSLSLSAALLRGAFGILEMLPLLTLPPSFIQF